MKMMSWSRYHALSWLVVRVRIHPHHRGVKRVRHPAKAVVMVASKAPAGGISQGDAKRRGRAPGRRLARALRSIIKIFRTRVLPGETDI